jgi:diadenosine tetraphosphatase ApaH/serine/threonine PP2A family protein phosphatase
VDGIRFVNTGSVGRPKDGDPRAGFVVVEMTVEGVAVEVERVEYDVARAARAIRESALPDDFAEQLEAGGTPAPTGGGDG